MQSPEGLENTPFTRMFEVSQKRKLVWQVYSSMPEIVFLSEGFLHVQDVWMKRAPS